MHHVRTLMAMEKCATDRRGVNVGEIGLPAALIGAPTGKTGVPALRRTIDLNQGFRPAAQ
jgi:hypothetical protein